MKTQTRKIDLIAVLKAASPEYGWVIHSNRRGGYIAEPNSTSLSRMVGLTQDPNEARFFGSHEANQADVCAFWQQGTPMPAVRTNGKIRLQ
jgi:hypothetical protein